MQRGYLVLVAALLLGAACVEAKEKLKITILKCAGAARSLRAAWERSALSRSSSTPAGAAMRPPRQYEAAAGLPGQCPDRRCRPTAAAAACSAAACRLLRRRKAEKCDVKAENGDSVEVHYLVRAPAISVGVNRWGQLNEPGSRGRSRGAVTRACCRLPWRPNPRALPNLRPPSHPPIHPPTTLVALLFLAGHADRRQEV